MQISRVLRRSAVALLLASPVFAQTGTQNFVGNVFITNYSYQLLGVPGSGGASSTGAAVLVQGGVYALNCLGTIGGATLQIQSLGADKATWVSAITSSGGSTAITTLPATITVYIGSSVGSSTPNVRMLVTGGTPSGLYCVLS